MSDAPRGVLVKETFDTENENTPELQRLGWQAILDNFGRNSQGVRIPKPLLEQAGLEDEVELHAEQGRIVIATVRRARSGWADAARAVHAAGGDRVESTGPTTFDQMEWEWR